MGRNLDRKCLCTGDSVFELDTLAFEHKLKLRDFRSGSCFADAGAENVASAFARVKLGIKTRNEANLLDVPRLFVPQMFVNVALVFLKPLKSVWVTFDLTEWDFGFDAMDNDRDMLESSGGVLSDWFGMDLELLRVRISTMGR